MKMLAYRFVHIIIALRFIMVLLVLGAASVCLASLGNATADQSNSMSTFGPSLSVSLLAGDSYAGLSSTVVATQGTGGGTAYYSTMTLLAGKASADTTVSVKWRTATLAESFGTSTAPPMNDSPGWAALLSDVVDLTGIAPSGGGAGGGRTQTDSFVLQMTYDQTVLVQTYQCPGCSTLGWTEQDAINVGDVQIGYLNLGADNSVGGTGADADNWFRDSLGNFGQGTTVVENYLNDFDGAGGNNSGSWANFALEYGVTDANLGQFLGSWGVDATDDHVWAVLNHNSQIAAIPEPAAACMFVLACGGFALRRRSR